VNGAIDGRVTSAEFKLYVLLLKYAFGKGQCFPSLATLSKELRVDEGPISRQLKALDKADYIDRHYGYEGNEFKLVFRLLV
jgi:DNA-binding MarR family transcriptional regulator